MIVNPNSDIILYSGMPLDDTYTDTLYFANIGAQTSFFTSGNTYEKRRFTANTYQRVNEGVFDANCLADEIYDCNYMAFRNTNFGTKWFYAFINRVEYVNNGMARVTFTIDSLQTYLFDCTLEECMVEREHSATDALFSNILPEPISLGEYEFDNYIPLEFASVDGVSVYESDICVQYVDDDEGMISGGGMWGNIFVGTGFKAFTTTWAGQDNCRAFLNSYIQKPDSIVNVYMAPHYITMGTESGDPAQRFNPPTTTMHFPDGYFRYIDGYEVINNKIFTYPYCFLHMDNSNGRSLALRYEFFSGEPNFVILGSAITPVQLTLAPTNYKKSANGETLFTECITLDEYPLCSWNYDTYRAWVAQNSVPLNLKQLGEVIGAGGQLLGGNVGGFVSGIGNAFLSQEIAYYKASIQADTIRGNTSNGNALFYEGALKFRYARCRQPLEIIKTVDDFFTMYGYTTNRVKVPNRAVRPHWTYCKTAGAKVIGRCPTEDLKKICSIYDSGITWWRDASEVGNYSLDNRPT